jgi:hypothetical protein
MTISINWSNKSSNTTGNIGVTSLTIGSTNAAESNGSIASGDFLIAILEVVAASDPGSAATSMTSAGFTTTFDHFDSNQVKRMYVGWKVAGSSESGTYSASWATASTGASWTLIDLASVNTSSPIDTSTITDTSYDGGLMPAPSISPSGSADWLMCVWFEAGGNNPYTVASGMTLLFDVGSSSSDRPEIMVGYLQLSSSGATGTKNASAANNTQTSGASIAFKPASGGGGSSSILLLASPQRRFGRPKRIFTPR